MRIILLLCLLMTCFIFSSTAMAVTIGQQKDKEELFTKDEAEKVKVFIKIQKAKEASARLYSCLNNSLSSKARRKLDAEVIQIKYRIRGVCARNKIDLAIKHYLELRKDIYSNKKLRGTGGCVDNYASVVAELPQEMLVASDIQYLLLSNRADLRKYVCR